MQHNCLSKVPWHPPPPSFSPSKVCWSSAVSNPNTTNTTRKKISCLDIPQFWEVFLEESVLLDFFCSRRFPDEDFCPKRVSTVNHPAPPIVPQVASTATVQLVQGDTAVNLGLSVVPSNAPAKI